VGNSPNFGEFGEICETFSSVGDDRWQRAGGRGQVGDRKTGRGREGKEMRIRARTAKSTMSVGLCDG
jgi:hypothetical protein